MIASTNPPSAAAWMIWARSLWWVEKPTNLRLARLPDRLGRLLELLALDQVDGVVERVVVAEAVDEEEVDVVGAQRRQPLVELPHDLRRAFAAGPW